MRESNRPLIGMRKLLLVDCDEPTQAMLTKSIRRLGMLASPVDLTPPDLKQDVIGLIVEIDDFKSEALVSRAQEQGLPIIAISRHETLSQIQSAIRIGATAMLNRPFTQSSVYTTLIMACSLKDQIKSLEDEVKKQSDQLRMRPKIATAVARLMHECEIDEHQAFERIRVLSMTLNLSIEQICSDREWNALSLGIER